MPQPTRIGLPCISWFLWTRRLVFRSPFTISAIFAAPTADKGVRAAYRLHVNAQAVWFACNQLAAFPQSIKQLSFGANGETILNPELPDMIKQSGLADQVKAITNANGLPIPMPIV